MKSLGTSLHQLRGLWALVVHFVVQAVQVVINSSLFLLQGIIDVFAIDCGKPGNKQTCRESQVYGFPTLKVSSCSVTRSLFVWGHLYKQYLVWVDGIQYKGYLHHLLCISVPRHTL